MEMMETYFCWLTGQEESDGLVITSGSVCEAAQAAVEKWRMIGLANNIHLPLLTVQVRDSVGKVHEVLVNQEHYIDYSGPEA